MIAMILIWTRSVKDPVPILKISSSDIESDDEELLFDRQATIDFGTSQEFDARRRACRETQNRKTSMTALTSPRPARPVRLLRQVSEKGKCSKFLNITVHNKSKDFIPIGTEERLNNMV
jgi:hypothetical protein